MPTPSLDSYQQLTMDALLKIRHEGIFERWREALRGSCEAYAIEIALAAPCKDATHALVRELESCRQKVMKDAGSLQAFRNRGLG
jgi:hypothetical protein